MLLIDLGLQQVVRRPRHDGAPVGPCLVYKSDTHQINVTDLPPAVEERRERSRLVSVGREKHSTTRFVMCDQSKKKIMCDACRELFARDAGFRCWR